MSAPVPQLVNISHALQASTFQQIRLDMVDFNKDCKLSSVQLARIDKYIDSLQAALNQFTRDNLHIERKDEAVSYTHLDVYKRQGVGGALALAGAAEPNAGAPNADGFAVLVVLPKALIVVLAVLLVFAPN